MPHWDTQYNKDDNTIEFTINGQYQVGWNPQADIPYPLTQGIRRLLDLAYGEGKRDRSKEIKKLIG